LPVRGFDRFVLSPMVMSIQNHLPLECLLLMRKGADGKQDKGWSPAACFDKHADPVIGQGPSSHRPASGQASQG
jgi:hypothetical protein